MTQRFSILLLILFLIGCTPQPVNTTEPTSLPSTASEAQRALIKFFSLLNTRRYEEAISLYGCSSDGSLFVLGPCCGANETEMPPVSQFEYKVTRDASGQFVVMDLPPYVP
jgi:hypothetical protein